MYTQRRDGERERESERKRDPFDRYRSSSYFLQLFAPVFQLSIIDLQMCCVSRLRLNEKKGFNKFTILF